MATPGLGLLLALGLQLLPPRWGGVLGLDPSTVEPLADGANTTTATTPGATSSQPNGALSQEAVTAIIVVFSLLAAILLAVGLGLLVRKLREKRQTEGTYRPSSEEQFSHAAETQEAKDAVRGCLPI